MEQEQQTPGQRALELIRVLLPNWPPTTQYVLRWIRLAIAVGIVILGVLLILDVVGSIFDIKFWQLLRVLAIPITVGAAVPWLNWLQKKREQDIENQRAQDAALQAYLDQIGELLLDKTPSLRDSGEGADVRNLARARTLTVVWMLDGSRKGSLLQFLYESQLISKDGAVIDLGGAYLACAHLWASNLREANLSKADLSKANLTRADLPHATLSEAILHNANLSRATLSHADLSEARLSGANLSEAGLSNADLSSADLREADLSKVALGGANLSNTDLSGASLRDAKLGYAALSRATLSNADLRGAELLYADLGGADLGGADLRDANMRHARGVTNERLELRARYLQGATMPNGQKYEDWLKDKKDWGQDMENPGTS